MTHKEQSHGCGRPEGDRRRHWGWSIWETSWPLVLEEMVNMMSLSPRTIALFIVGVISVGKMFNPKVIVKSKEWAIASARSHLGFLWGIQLSSLLPPSFILTLGMFECCKPDLSLFYLQSIHFNGNLCLDLNNDPSRYEDKTFHTMEVGGWEGQGDCVCTCVLVYVKFCCVRKF